MSVAIDYRPALFAGAGVARYVRELTRALKSSAAPLDVRLFGAAWRRPRPDSAPAPFPICAPRIPGRLLCAFPLVGVGADTLCGGVRVFHYTDVVFPPVIHARRLVTIHDLLFESDEPYHDVAFRRVVSARLRREAGRADHIIAVSERTKSEVVSRHGIAPENITVVPLGADHLDGLATTAPTARTGRPYFLCVGTLEPRKNLARVLRAFEIVTEKLPHRLLIAGASGWMMQEFNARLGKSPRRDRVEVLGPVDDTELVLLYRGADALVYPSLQEGFGLPVAEALRLGLPVITSAGTPMADLFAHAALIVPPREVEAIADAMQRCAQDSVLREDLRAAGVLATRALTWSETARRTSQVYERVARTDRQG